MRFVGHFELESVKIWRSIAELWCRVATLWHLGKGAVIHQYLMGDPWTSYPSWWHYSTSELVVSVAEAKLCGLNCLQLFSISCQTAVVMWFLVKRFVQACQPGGDWGVYLWCRPILYGSVFLSYKKVFLYTGTAVTPKGKAGQAGWPASRYMTIQLDQLFESGYVRH